MRFFHSILSKLPNQKLLKRKHLLIGCGRKNQCRQSHPHADFVTLDVAPNAKPDLICDAFDVPAVTNACASFQKFDTIIYEYLPWPNNFNPLELAHLLSPNGSIILVGPKLNNAALYLPVGQQFLFSPKDNITVIAPAGTPEISNTIRSYLYKAARHSHPEFSTFTNTEELKLRAQCLLEAKKIISREMDYLFYMLNDIMLDSSPIQPISIAELKLTTENKVDDFYINFVSDSTRSMDELREFIQRFNDKPDNTHLNAESLIELFLIILRREERCQMRIRFLGYNGYLKNLNNPVTMIYHQLAARIFNYVIHHESLYQEFTAAFTKNTRMTHRFC